MQRLVCIGCDRLENSNKKIIQSIEVDQEEVTYGHIIYSPTEVLTEEDSNGQMIALCISDAAGTKTLIKLQPR